MGVPIGRDGLSRELLQASYSLGHSEGMLMMVAMQLRRKTEQAISHVAAAAAAVAAAAVGARIQGVEKIAKRGLRGGGGGKGRGVGRKGGGGGGGGGEGGGGACIPFDAKKAVYASRAYKAACSCWCLSYSSAVRGCRRDDAWP